MPKAQVLARKNASRATPKVINTVVTDARVNIIEMERLKEATAQNVKFFDARDVLEQIHLIKEGKLDVKLTSNGNFTITTKTDGNLELTSNKKVKKQPRQMNQSKQGLGSQNPSMNFKAKAKAAKRSQVNKLLKSYTCESDIINSAIKKINFVSELDRGILTPKSPVSHRLAQIPLTYPTHYQVKDRDGEWKLFKKNQNQVNWQQEIKDVGHFIDEQLAHLRRFAPEMNGYEEGGRGSTEISRFERSQIDPGHLSHVTEGPPETVYPKTVQPPTKIPQGYREFYETGTRLFVSNLHQTVSEKDIRELFGEVGQLRRVSIVTRGVAEVIYVTKDFAKQAVQMYHNRLLDGMPMRCQVDDYSCRLQPLQEYTGYQAPHQSFPAHGHSFLM